MTRTAVLLAAACVFALGVPLHMLADAVTPLATPAPLPATPELPAPSELVDAVPVSLTIENAGSADRLLGGSTPYADRVEIHETRLVHGQQEMEELPAGLPIPGGATLLLEPGANHLMLRGLRQHLVQGATFPLTLQIARAGEATITVRVRRKLDAAGVNAIPPVVARDLRLSLASAPPAPAGTPTAG